MIRGIATALLIAVAALPVAAHAQSTPASAAAPAKIGSIAFEADVLAYGLKGYSAMVNVSHKSGLQMAFGTGRYDVPSFLLEGDANYEQAEWKATSTSVQVLRMTYRLNGPMKSGPALGAVVLNQHWKMSSETLRGSTKFQPVSVGLTGGYYQKLGKHFYVYPTAAFTLNHVASGRASVNGTAYKVAKLGPNASLHMGWERAW